MSEPKSVQPSWDDHYAEGAIPWDTGEPEEHLVRLVDGGAVPAGGRAFEVGCGTGTNSVWLAERGFEVVGCDLSPRALAAARSKARGVSDRCRFLELDFLGGALPDPSFDLVFDRGVFHCFDHAHEQARFAERVAGLLRPGGRWASLAGSTEGPAREHGPPRRSLREIVGAVEPWLEVVELTRVEFTANIPSPAAGWWFVARKREVAAQPPTLREP